jgi:Ni,Fe-hydrogenase III small subunit
MMSADRKAKHEAGQQNAARGQRRRAHARTASDPATPPGELVHMARRHPWSHSLIAANPSAPAPLLTVLAERGDARVRLEVAGNPSTPEKTLAHLAYDEVAEVSDTAARRRAARSLPRYEEVARWSIVEQLAIVADRHADAEVLDVLSYWPRRVRVEVARNPATGATTLARLAVDTKPSVRREAASHRSTPSESVEALVRDGDRFVRRAVAARRDASERALVILAADRHPAVREAVAGNPHTPAEAVVALAKDTDLEVRRRIAARKRLPAGVQEWIAADTDAKIRATIAKNPFCTEEVLDKLCQDADPKVRQTARERGTAAVKVGVEG